MEPLTSARLRQLSIGTQLTTPVESHGGNKFKFADFRYGQEELLAMYDGTLKPPELLQKCSAVYVDKALPPVSLQDLSEEEEVVIL